MKINVIYNNGKRKYFDTYQDISNKENAKRIIFPDGLQKIYLDNNKIISLVNTTFPDTLQELSLSCNRITSLKNVVFPDTLQELNLSGNRITSLENIVFPDDLVILNLNHNQIRSLENIIFPDILQILWLQNNKITSLENISFSDGLQELYLYNNQMISLENVTFADTLQILDLGKNQIRSLENVTFPDTLQLLNLDNTKITSLENIIFPNTLQILNLSFNKITSLGNVTFPDNLQVLDLRNNNITSLPITLIHTRIQTLRYDNNPIEHIPPQVRRWLGGQRNTQKLQIYNDGQNVHNHSIQESIRHSIENITNQPFKCTQENIELIMTDIYQDNILTDLSKQALTEYSQDQNIHSVLQLTFKELLFYVWKTIQTFNTEMQIEVKKILNEEIQNAICKCFTGRMSRLINCINCFTPLVNIVIDDNQQIGNIIVLIQNKLKNSETYSIEKHKELVRKELRERGYTDNIIEEWIGYIE